MSDLPRLLIFDVNETLLDLTPLEKKINKALENPMAFKLWFRMLLHYSLVETTTQNFTDFSEIGKATFKMLSGELGKDLKDKETKDILSTINQLPVHDDVPEALNNLKQKGFTLIALTNGGLETAKSQLKYAKIDTYFDAIFGVDSVKKYKPHPDTYKYVLNELKIDNPRDGMLVAAHGWDVVGAQRAGLKTCFVSRPGKFVYPLAEEPTLKIKNLSELASKLH